MSYLMIHSCKVHTLENKGLSSWNHTSYLFGSGQHEILQRNKRMDMYFSERKEETLKRKFLPRNESDWTYTS